MLASDLIQIALRQLYRNRRRYKSVILLTSLGIAGLVTVLTVGDSVETDLGLNLELLGSATILKATYNYNRSHRWHHVQYFQSDVDSLRKLPGVRTVSPVVWTGADFRHGAISMYGRVMGVGDDFFDTIHIPTAKGRKISAEDVEHRSSVCVVGQTVMKKLFKGDTEPADKEILVSGRAFRVIGLIGGVEDESLFEAVLIPISIARSTMPRMYAIKDIYVRAANWDVVFRLHDDILQVLRDRQPGYAESMEVIYYPDGVHAIKDTVLIFKLFLYAALGMTLLLGGLGITNVMHAAVRERTTEIGLRKAVGATEHMILTQFLLEAVSIGLMGAVLGMVIGLLSVEVLRDVMKTVPEYNTFVASLAGGVVFGIVVGMISGFIPARKASRLDAADAMRFE